MDALVSSLVFGLCFTALVLSLLLFKIKTDQRRRRKAPGEMTARLDSNDAEKP